MKNIEKPVFIIGAGRSGTTVLYHLLTFHKDLCWFSNVSDRYPRAPILPLANRVIELPWIGKKVKTRILNRTIPSLRPVEGPVTYHKYGQFDYRRRMTEEDWTPELEERLKGAMRNHLQWTGKARFLSKQTANNQRIRLINKMFPDANYVHIIRDGRGVASSLLKVPWHERIYFWWLDGGAEKWREMGRDPIELCAVHWEMDEREILQNKHLFAERYLEIRYEDLVVETNKILKTILDFCQLDDYPEFYEDVPKLKNMNYKWGQGLSEEQKHMMEASIGDFLVELGYELETIGSTGK
jgi:omega-hydroxy-beta-dihydromenaquinone-9 sulfotransferase